MAGKICSLESFGGDRVQGPIINRVWVFAPKERDVFMRTLFVVLLLISSTAFAQSKVAVVKMLRGEATMNEGGKDVKLALEQWIPSGVIVKTSEKSFVRLVFIDKSLMNIGPNSEMKIEQFGGGDAGVIDLVKGQIRSQVSKDYLQQKDKDKSKMFIKTPNAVMGIRGTDFLISTNGVNSSAVLFEGEVVFNKISESAARNMNTNALEAAVDRGVRIFPGEFSVVEANRPNPTVPSILNVQQIEKLESNKDFSQSGATDSSAQIGKSVVPNGLTGAVVSNESTVLNKELEQTGVVGNVDGAKPVNAEFAKGFVSESEVKPTNGSILHVETGVVIAPPKDAVFDANSNTFIPPTGSGTITADGSFAPPPGMDITPTGEVLVKVDNQVVKLDKISPVTGQGATFGDVAKVADKTTAGVAPASSNTIVPRSPVAGDKTAKLVVLSAAGANITTPISTGGVTTTPVPIVDSTFREAPTLCSTCGGAIPGMAAGSANTPVTVNPTIGDP